MTPRDSGKRKTEREMCTCGSGGPRHESTCAVAVWLREQADSDAHEVCGAGVSDRWPRYETFTCELPKGHGGFHEQGDTTWTDALTQPATIVPVVISLDFAQRILAALEGEAAFLHNEGKESGSRMLYDVASELRAVIGK